MKKIYKKGREEAERREREVALACGLEAARESRERQARRAEKAAAKRAKIRSAKKRNGRKSAASSVAPAGPKNPVFRVGAPHPGYERGGDFYLTREWRQLRYLVLRNAGGKCACCGASAADGARIHVDHIIPRYKRPDLSLSLDNLQALCEDCNLGKGAWDSTDWRK